MPRDRATMAVRTAGRPDSGDGPAGRRGRRDTAMEDGLTFGDLLRRHRRAAGLSQEALAERARLSARAISDLERGVKHAPRPTTVQLLAQALPLSDADRAAFIAAARHLGAPRRCSAVPPDQAAPGLPGYLTPLIG